VCCITASVLSISFLAAVPAHAQRQADTDSTIFVLPGIMVNAARTPTGILSVPLAVTLVGRTGLEHRNGFRLEQAFEGVPGVLAQSRYGTGDVRIVIRGFGARGAGDRSNAGTSRGIRILQDGIPETEPDGRTSFDLLDLEAMQGVEIVRSNASALWGNAAGGVINFISRPAFTEPFLRYEQNVAGFGMRRQITQAGAQLGQSKLVVSLIWTRFDGWRRNSEAERKLLSTTLAAPIGPQTDLQLNVLAADNTFEIPGPLTQAQLDADPEQANPTYLTRRERRLNRLGRIGASIQHRLSHGQSLSGMLFANPKYLQRSERGTYRDFNRYHVGGNLVFRDSRTLGQNLASAFTIGTDEAYQDGAIVFYNLTPDAERGTTVAQDKREGANNFGFFAQEQLGFGSRVELTLGMRYDNVTYYSDNFLNPAQNARKSFERWTPKLGLLYRASETRSFYGNVGGGVEVPAGNETDPATLPGSSAVTTLNPILEPIRSTTFEIGAKEFRTSSGFVQMLSYDAALYLTSVTNEIVPYRGGAFYLTAGKAQRKGAELGLQMQTSAGLSLGTALTFSDNVYQKYVVDSVYYGRPGQQADYSDNHVVGVPEFFSSATLRWSPAVASAFEVGAGLLHTGDFFADDANQLEIPGYTVFHATLGLRRPVALARRFRVSGFVRVENLTDREYVGSAFLNPDIVGGVPVAFEPGLPRHVFVSLSLGWGG